jgi:hypothetical protein
MKALLGNKLFTVVVLESAFIELVSRCGDFMTTAFTLEHDFKSIPLEKFIAHLNEPKLNKMLEKGLSFSERSLVSRKEDGEDIEWQFRVKKSGDLPSAIKKVLKTDSFSWHEISRFVRKENCIHWEILPDSAWLKFHGEGIWLLKKANKGCKRVIEGKVTVEIPIVGKMVEAFIVNELVKSYEIEPKIQEEFYAQVL